MEFMRHKMKVESERRSVCRFVKKSQSTKIIKLEITESAFLKRKDTKDIREIR